MNKFEQDELMAKIASALEEDSEIRFGKTIVKQANRQAEDAEYDAIIDDAAQSGQAKGKPIGTIAGGAIGGVAGAAMGQNYKAGLLGAGLGGAAGYLLGGGIGRAVGRGKGQQEVADALADKIIAEQQANDSVGTPAVYHQNPTRLAYMDSDQNATYIQGYNDLVSHMSEAGEPMTDLYGNETLTPEREAKLRQYMDAAIDRKHQMDAELAMRTQVARRQENMRTMNNIIYGQRYYYASDDEPAMNKLAEEGNNNRVSNTSTALEALGIGAASGVGLLAGRKLGKLYKKRQLQGEINKGIASAEAAGKKVQDKINQNAAKGEKYTNMADKARNKYEDVYEMDEDHPLGYYQFETKRSTLKDKIKRSAEKKHEGLAAEMETAKNNINAAKRAKPDQKLVDRAGKSGSDIGLGVGVGLGVGGAALHRDRQKAAFSLDGLDKVAEGEQSKPAKVNDGRGDYEQAMVKILDAIQKQQGTTGQPAVLHHKGYLYSDGKGRRVFLKSHEAMGQHLMDEGLLDDNWNAVNPLYYHEIDDLHNGDGGNKEASELVELIKEAKKKDDEITQAQRTGIAVGGAGGAVGGGMLAQHSYKQSLKDKVKLDLLSQGWDPVDIEKHWDEGYDMAEQIFPTIKSKRMMTTGIGALGGGLVGVSLGNALTAPRDKDASEDADLEKEAIKIPDFVFKKPPGSWSDHELASAYHSIKTRPQTLSTTPKTASTPDYIFNKHPSQWSDHELAQGYNTIRQQKMANDLDGLDKEAAKLTQQDRDELPEDDFVFPDSRRYPIYDKSHARAALRFSAGKSEERKVRQAVYARYPEMKKAAFEEICELVKEAGLLGTGGKTNA